MLFLNEGEIIRNAASDKLRRLRRDALDILSKAVEAVDPKKAVQRMLKIEGKFLKTADIELDLERFNRIFVVGGGKAGVPMAEAVEAILGDRISDGALNVLEGAETGSSLTKIRLIGASHPIPGESGVRGVGQMMSLLTKTRKDDLVIVLISGGGSSLMTYPAGDVSLSDVQFLTDQLLRRGATINELNAVRKHLSVVKGGLMAKLASPASVLSLILSDVVDDPLDTIASGPTAPDQTTFDDAIEVLKKYCFWGNASEAVLRRLGKGLRGEIEETPKTGDPIFKRVYNVVVGSNLTAARAALRRAEALGYNSMLLSTSMEGEAREIGIILAGLAKEVRAREYPVEPPAALILGGETTVTVGGDGVGGRNQELALSASTKLEGMDSIIASLATDGIDGPTDAAGAIVDGSTMNKARSMGLEVSRFLDNNDSNQFFSRLGDALITGPTGTNVNDIMLILVVD
ncbi:MAG: glycerate kinase [Candidatus Bathyarchaeota archaeon]|nr:MAG: glycerate kinase [Candidatus Bathyarchaeota archaeon]